MSINIPNLLSLFRIAAAPFLLLCGWFGLPKLFFLLFCLMLLSDAVDGYIARKLNQVSALGAKLDSMGDTATYLSTALAAWWLWPELIAEEAAFIVSALVIYITPAFFSLAKFGQLASYHTWITKASAVLMSVSVLLLLAADIRVVFHIAVIFLVIEAAENIAITLMISKPRNDIRSFWHLLKSRR